jgi:uncharacterized membrane protein
LVVRRDEEDDARPLDATTAELVAHLQKNRDADVAAYDRVHEQILKMADMLSDGIIRQFPVKLT